MPKLDYEEISHILIEVACAWNQSRVSICQLLPVKEQRNNQSNCEVCSKIE